MCYNPITLENRDAVVPCNKCPKCRARGVSSWSYRLMQEAKVSSSAYFVTLTFDEEHVPRSKRNYRTLDKDPLQKFFKRLRKINPGKRIKYFAVGEYGGQTMRPHYHIILFNAQYETIDQAWTINGKLIGYTFTGTVNEASVGYCLKYIMKKSKVPQHRNDDRQKERSYTSLGLGLSYLNNRTILWHKSDIEANFYLPLKDGKKAPMARYYKDKIYTEEEKEIAQYAHILRMRQKAEKEIALIGDYEYFHRQQQKILEHYRKVDAVHAKRTGKNAVIQ